MSTRCEIAVCANDGRIRAKLYRHCDGYPDVVTPDLVAGVKEAYETLTNTGHGLDAEKLAALLICQSLDKRCMPRIVPCQNTHEDLAYRYQLTIFDDSTVTLEESECGHLATINL
ncbi:hypothetical protein Spb1_22650 [Planctopirus ephydatiae]|uniref:Uncharacterized protein n=1 Tax=Planctopirus ephydatiae TaxID=2528019 RepID=A0A518GP32_9PLAN|nr:hypothetical protein [Planctopirus ephydatiae]QDV30336.1 hypothetical protein Spb1_22650 [Planctopirus ephydatiae]